MINGVDLFQLGPHYSVRFALRVPKGLLEGAGPLARDGGGRTILNSMKPVRIVAGKQNHHRGSDRQ